MFSAILFDLDGTLIDSLPDLAVCANRTLAARSLPTHSFDAYRYFIGDGPTELFRRALPASKATETAIAECIADFRADYGRHWHNATRLFDGVEPLLDNVTRVGIRLAVLSNKPHDFTTQCVDHFLSKWRIEQILGSGERFARKPDPAGALHLAEQMALSPADILYVGDTATDMQTALAAVFWPDVRLG